MQYFKLVRNALLYIYIDKVTPVKYRTNIVFFLQSNLYVIIGTTVY